jgi:putative hemolysin
MVARGVHAADRVLGLTGCAALYDRISGVQAPEGFMRALLAKMDVRCEPSRQEIEQIPRKGPLVVVANHPFGGIEGIVLADLLISVRPDLKIMANFMLNRIPQLRGLTIPVDPFNRPGSARSNAGPIRAALRWVEAGGMLLVFPAGEVAHFKLRRWGIADSAWSPSVGLIVRRARAAVLPIFVRGRNGLGFHAAGMIHPRLRTALLARELINKQRRRVDVKIGAPIAFRWTQRYPDDSRRVEYLRWRTLILGCRPSAGIRMPAIVKMPRARKEQPLARPQETDLCRREIERLPFSQRLAQSGDFSVWQAEAGQIPHLLQEIGRLREISFRAASEGTGNPVDLDRFDPHYLHLFVWNEAAAEIVGAYRLGRSDILLSRFGRKGLYTSTLFHTQAQFFKRLGPALELGRSFVRPEYQRSYAPLLLLWKGIGGFIGRHPRYRRLFGPVSISRDYSDLSRRLIATTLLQHSQAKDLALMVRPRRPAKIAPIRIPGCAPSGKTLHLADFKEVCAVIADIEFQKRDVPVLLRHYLNLGGQLLGFNIDRGFGNVMDGLIVVDLLQTDRKTLERYMGEEGVAALMACHGACAEAESPPAAREAQRPHAG